MEYRTLGLSRLEVPVVSFGAGPVSQLLVGGELENQRRTVFAALDAGIDWFDTAAGYGDGESERNLGKLLGQSQDGQQARIATKVRLRPEQFGAIGSSVRDSLRGSLERLGRPRVTLLQLHNSITAVVGAQPTSLTPAHVLGAGGVLEAMRRARDEGLVEHLGLTGIGEPAALAEVLASGEFAILQIPYNLLNPSAGQTAPQNFGETDYGDLIHTAAWHGVGVFAIRVLAGGALAGRSPSPHTLKTPFFPLDLYQRDCCRAERLAARLPPGMSREEAAVRFALSHPSIASAIVGLGTPEEVRDVVGFAARGALDAELLARLNDDDSSQAASGT